MHQCVSWEAVKGLTLQQLVAPLHICSATTYSNSRRCSALCQGRHRAHPIAAALRRPTAAQRGAKYYENYLRNRQEKGGVFLGPPLQDTAPQHAQQDGPAAQNPQGISTSQAAPTVKSSSSDNIDSASTTTPTANEYSSIAPTSQDPARFWQLLEECMLLTAPRPVGLHNEASQSGQLTAADSAHNSKGLQGTNNSAASQPAAVQPPADADAQQQQQLGLRAQPLCSPTPFQYQQQPRQPWQFRDYMEPELAKGLLPALKRRGGLVIEPPLFQQREPLMSLPQLPTTSSSSSSSSSTSRTRVLHIYWDISSAHPGGADPRVIVAHLRRVLGSYGQIAGMYAYGVQKMFNWIPEAFMLQYAPERLPGGKRKRIAISAKQQQQEQQLEQQLQAAAAAGLDLDETLGPLRCPCCGKLRSNYHQLHLHMVQRHKQPAPPLTKLVPASMIATATAAAARGVSASSVPLQQQQSQLPASAVSWMPSDVKSMMNNSTRTLGRVARYHNSQGALFVPPDGHQISLKYVLLREGVEVRLVQNHKHAVDVTVAEGLHLLLQQLLNRDAVSAQQYEDVVVVISDKGTHTEVLKRFQKAGFGVIAICRGIQRYFGADITLRWQRIVDGRYRC